jgi:ABC-type amino acid transport substrate-binding protein
MKKSIFLFFFWIAGVLHAETITFALGDWEPYVGKSLKGYGKVAQVMTKACQKAGLTCKYEFMPWSRAMNMVTNGKVAGSFPWSVTEERTKQFFVSDESAIVSKIVFFYTKDIVFPENAENNFSLLGGFPVAGIQDYGTSEAIKKAGVKIRLHKNSKTAWKRLQKDYLDANGSVKSKADLAEAKDKILPSVLQVGYAECQKYTPALCKHMKVSKPTSESALHIMFSRTKDGTKAIKEKLDKALAEMKKNGEYDAIMNTQ